MHMFLVPVQDAKSFGQALPYGLCGLGFEGCRTQQQNMEGDCLLETRVLSQNVKGRNSYPIRSYNKYGLHRREMGREGVLV